MSESTCNTTTFVEIALSSMDLAGGGHSVTKPFMRKLADQNHPHILVCQPDDKGSTFKANDYVETLSSIVRQHAFVLADFTRLVEALLSALEAAHSMDITHGQLNGDHIIFLNSVDGNYDVKIRNFLGGGEEADSLQYCKEADLYSAGCMLYFSLCGRYPNEFSNLGKEELDDEVLIYPISFYRKDLPEGWSDWVMSLCSKDKEGRPSSSFEALEMFRELECLASVSYAPYVDQNVVGGVYARSISTVPSKLGSKSCRVSGETAVVKNKVVNDDFQSGWRVSRNGVQILDLSLDDLKGDLENRSLDSSDLVCHDILDGWTPVRECSLLRKYIPQTESPSLVGRRLHIALGDTHEEYKGMTMELMISMTILMVAVGMIALKPELRSMTILYSVFFLLVAGIACLKCRELQQSSKWLWMGLLLPVISDVLFITRHFRAAWRPVFLILFGIVAVMFLVFFEMDSLQSLGVTEKIDVICEGLNMSDVIK